MVFDEKSMTPLKQMTFSCKSSFGDKFLGSMLNNYARLYCFYNGTALFA